MAQQYRSVDAQTNSFLISRWPQRKFVMYDVQISPEIPKSAYRRRDEIIHKLQAEVAPMVFTPRVLYDGMGILYAAYPGLKASSGEVVGNGYFDVNMSRNPNSNEVYGEKGVYRVTLTRTVADVVDTRVLERFVNRQPGYTDINAQAFKAAVNVINLILRADAQGAHPHNSRAYFPGSMAGGSNSRIIRGSGIMLVRGYFQSVKPVIERLLVNVDTVTAVMYQSGSAVNVAMGRLNLKNARDLSLDPKVPTFRELQNFFIGCRVQVNHRIKRTMTRTIRGLVSKAGYQEFEIDKSYISIRDYYRDYHNIQINLPNIIGFQLGNRDRSIIVPAELCEVLPGQFYRKELSKEYASEFHKFCSARPAERFSLITGGDNSPVTAFWQSGSIYESGMRVSSTPTIVNGQNLSPPRIECHGRKTVHPDNGSWNMNGQKLYRAAKIARWACINYSGTFSNDDRFKQAIIPLKRCCERLGMDVNLPSVHQGMGLAPLTVMGEVKRALPEKERFDLVFVVLPENGEEIRNTVKHFFDIRVGISSQCVRESKFSKGNDQYLTNLVLKINARIGGINFVPQGPAMKKIEEERIMVCGADVSHPGSGIDRPSVAGLVASYNVTASQYSAFSLPQVPRLEVIDELHVMFLEALKVYRHKNRLALPSKIVFFRDGVSEGEYDQIRKQEIPQIYTALKDFVNLFAPADVKASYVPPKLTYVVIGKRHHSFFGPTNVQDADKNGNMKPGFVTESGLENPFVIDFYLQGHTAIKGTARTAHAIVLKDEVFGGDTNRLKELIFSLCHVYERATRSVSIPAPVYYADLVCARSKFHFADVSDDDSMVSAHDNIGHWKRLFGRVHTNLIDKMYFI